MAEDDSYIHRRIAINLVDSGRAYFNLNEPVMVTSSPLWTIILATSMLWTGAKGTVEVLELMALLWAAGVSYLLLRSKHSEFVAIVAAVITFLVLLPSAMQEMETPCALALLLCGCLGIRRKAAWGSALLVLACFTRYECIPFCLIALSLAIPKREWSKRSVLVGGFILIVISSGIWLQYGTFVPNSVVAKERVYSLTRAESAWMLWGSNPCLPICMLLAGLWWFYGRRCVERDNDVSLELILSSTVVAGLYIYRKTLIFPWYPPLVWLPVILGLLLKTKPQSKLSLVLGVSLAAGLASQFLEFDSLLMQSAIDKRLNGELIPRARIHEYLRIGVALSEACPSGSLMTSEIGALGWTFRGRILDGAGIASPSALHYHPMPIPEERQNGLTGAIPPGYLRAEMPDLVVTYDIFAEAALPAARDLGYEDFSYPIYAREDEVASLDLFGAQAMHVLVKPGGKCVSSEVQRAILRHLKD